MSSEIDAVIALPPIKEAYHDFLFNRGMLRGSKQADDLVRLYERVAYHREAIDQMMAERQEDRYATSPATDLQPIRDIVAEEQDEALARLSAVVGHDAALAAVHPQRFSKRHPIMVGFLRYGNSTISKAAYDRMMAGANGQPVFYREQFDRLGWLFFLAFTIFLFILVASLFV